MTKKEALKRALKELVEARHNLRNGQKNGVPPDQLAALREKVEYRETVVEALRPMPHGEPLTLEQLREMDGEPAWIKQLKGLSVSDTDWAVVEFRLEPDVKHDKIRVWWPGSEDEDTPSEDDYGKTWLAYRRPPEGDA